MKTKTMAVIAGVAAMVALTPQVQANSILELISGTSTVTVQGVNGFATYAGSIGGWTITVDTGLAAPADGAPGESMDLDYDGLAVTSVGLQALTVTWTVSGYGVPPYSPPNTVTAAIGGTGGTGVGVTFSTYYGATLLTTTSSSNPAFSGTQSASIPGGTLVPYTLTEEIVLSASAGQASGDTTLTENAVPDGGFTLTLLGGAMASLAVVRSRMGKRK